MDWREFIAGVRRIKFRMVFVVYREAQNPIGSQCRGEEFFPMSSNDIERIVIRHVSGSKANQIEQIPLVDLTEITIGRDPSSNIAFDPPRDDIASRRHAVIRVVRGDQISFRLADLAAATGLFSMASGSRGRRSFFPRIRLDCARTG
jgi:serine protease Do